MVLTDYRESHSSTDYGEVYDKTYQEGYYHYQWELLEKPLLNQIFSDLAEAGARSCLDFACGTGRVTAVAEEFFAPVVGVDVSASMIGIAEQRVGTAELLRQDITRSPLRSTFHVCTAFRFFLNAERSLRREALAAIHRHLADNGVLIANIHVNSRSILGGAYRVRNRLYGRTAANVESYEGFAKSLRDAGFVIEDVIWYSYLPRIGWFFPGLAKHGMLPVERFSQRCGLVPAWMAQSFLVIARRQGVVGPGSS